MKLYSISGKLGNDERQIIAVGPKRPDGKKTRIAYGAVGEDGATYALVHAPTQDDFDEVASALDAAAVEEIAALVAEGDAETISAEAVGREFGDRCNDVIDPDVRVDAAGYRYRR